MSKNDHLVMPEDHMDKLYNSRNPLVSFVHRQRLISIANVMPIQNGLRVLDAGCGEGHLVEELYRKNPNNIYQGVDVTKIAIQKASVRCPFASFDIMDLTSLQLEDGFFDVVIATEVLEHVIEYEAAIAELKRVLGVGGVFIVTFPNETLWTISRFFLGRRPIKVPDHVNSFTPKKMKEIVALELLVQKNLPLGLPPPFSLGIIMKFRK